MKKQIKIGRTNYKIFLVHYVDDQYSLGKIRFSSNTQKKNIILIDKEQNKINQEKTLYHEIVHALLYEYSKRKNTQFRFRGKMYNLYEWLTCEEEFVESLSITIRKIFSLRRGTVK